MRVIRPRIGDYKGTQAKANAIPALRQDPHGQKKYYRLCRRLGVAGDNTCKGASGEHMHGQGTQARAEGTQARAEVVILT